MIAFVARVETSAFWKAGYATEGDPDPEASPPLPPLRSRPVNGDGVRQWVRRGEGEGESKTKGIHALSVT